MKFPKNCGALFRPMERWALEALVDFAVSLPVWQQVTFFRLQIRFLSHVSATTIADFQKIFQDLLSAAERKLAAINAEGQLTTLKSWAASEREVANETRG